LFDSVPVPVVKLVKERTYRAFRNDFETSPEQGFNAVNTGSYTYYKLHPVIFHNAMVQKTTKTKMKVLNINYMKLLYQMSKEKQLFDTRS
jgi:hypothetical protein